MNESPPSDFWEDFVAYTYEKKPLLLKKFFQEPLANEDELFHAILNKPIRSKSDRFWVARSSDGAARNYQMVDMGVFGPKEGDKGFDGFFSRVAGNLGGRAYGLNVHSLQTGSPEMWFRFRKFTRGLINRVGLPTQKCDIDTFFGTYQFTPFGIHQDNASVFAIGVKGRRTYYAWPSDYFKKGDDALHTAETSKFEHHLEHAIKMELEPGDLVYWPSSHWHVVGSDGSPSVVIQFSTYFGVSLSNLVGRLVADAIVGQITEDSPSHYSGPEVLDQAGHLAKKVAEDGTIDQSIKGLWLRRRSAEGYLDVPPLDLGAPTSDSISGLKRESIAKAVLGEELLVGSNGHLFRGPSVLSSFLDKSFILEETTAIRPGEKALVRFLLQSRSASSGVKEEA